MSFITTPTTTVSFTRQTRTSNTQLTASNLGQLIYITSGTFTQTFDACASLGSGWYCYIENAGTGNITLDPFGSETIDGLTSFIMYPGEVRLIQCDGTNLISIVQNAFAITYTASGTFTKPPGYASIGVFVLGAGGGGGSGKPVGGGRGGVGGAGGGALTATFLSSEIAASVIITVGSGGNGGVPGVPGSGTSTSGGPGGNSSFGSFLVGYGGGGGAGGPTFGAATTAAYGGGVINASSGQQPSGMLNNTDTSIFYNEFGGASTGTYTGSNASPPTAGKGSLYGGAAGGIGQTHYYSASAGGISRLPGTQTGGGAAGAIANGGPGGSGVGTYGAGGGGSGTGGTGGAGGFGCGGGGGGCHDINQTAASGGAGGVGLVQIWGVV